MHGLFVEMGAPNFLPGTVVLLSLPPKLSGCIVSNCTVTTVHLAHP
jgi:hypothetical protein